MEEAKVKAMRELRMRYTWELGSSALRREPDEVGGAIGWETGRELAGG